MCWSRHTTDLRNNWGFAAEIDKCKAYEPVHAHHPRRGKSVSIHLYSAVVVENYI